MRPGRILALLLLATPAIFPAAARAQSFEGTVRQRMILLGAAQIAALTGGEAGARPDPAALFEADSDRLAELGGTTVQTAQSFKDGRIRTDLPGLPGIVGAAGEPPYVVIDSAGGVVMVIPMLKQAMTMPVEQLADLTGAAAADPGDPPGEGPRALGTDTIRGVEAMGFEMVSGDAVMRGWLAPSYERVSAAMLAIAARVPGLMSAMDGTAGRLPPFDRGLPMRSETLSPIPDAEAAMLGRGWMYVRLEVIEVDEAKLDDSFFQVPDGYTTVAMPSLR